MPECSASPDENSWRCSKHPNHVHARDWDQVQACLDAGIEVLDRDGDVVTRILAVTGAFSEQGAGMEKGSVHLRDYGDQQFSYHAKTILIAEEPVEPVTQEEEDAALASILGALQQK